MARGKINPILIPGQNFTILANHAKALQWFGQLSKNMKAWFPVQSEIIPGQLCAGKE
jgi:hypothetical protein